MVAEIGQWRKVSIEWGAIYTCSAAARCPSSSFDSDLPPRDKWTIFCDGSWCGDSNRGGFATVAMKDEMVFCLQSRVDRQLPLSGRCEVTGSPCWGRDCRGVAAAGGCFRLGQHRSRLGLGVAGLDVGLRKEGFTAFSQRPGWFISHILRENNLLADAVAKLASRRRWEWSHLDAIPLVVARFHLLA